MWCANTIAAVASLSGKVKCMFLLFKLLNQSTVSRVVDSCH